MLVKAAQTLTILCTWENKLSNCSFIKYNEKERNQAKEIQGTRIAQSLFVPSRQFKRNVITYRVQSGPDIV